MKIEALVIVGVFAGAIYVAVKWVMRGELSPDPWGPEVDERIHRPEALPVCHRCFAPQEHDRWFCPECGTAVGPYNNYLPYVYIFSEGEVLRAAVTDHIRVNFLTVAGSLLYSLSTYMIFAPIYWYFLFRNLRQRANESDAHPNPGPNGAEA